MMHYLVTVIEDSPGKVSRESREVIEALLYAQACIGAQIENMKHVAQRWDELVARPVLEPRTER